MGWHYRLGELNYQHFSISSIIVDNLDTWPLINFWWSCLNCWDTVISHHDYSKSLSDQAVCFSFHLVEFGSLTWFLPQTVIVSPLVICPISKSSGPVFSPFFCRILVTDTNSTTVTNSFPPLVIFLNHQETMPHVSPSFDRIPVTDQFPPQMLYTFYP